MKKYAKRLLLDATEISALRQSLDTEIERIKKIIPKEKKFYRASTLSWLKYLKKLRKKLRRMEIRIEKEVLKDIRKKSISTSGNWLQDELQSRR